MPMKVRTSLAHAILVLAALAICPPAGAQDASPPPILQLFETGWQTIEQRMPDVFHAGYGAMWLPPPGRADSGDQSAGYDVFDRFDLGEPGRPTLYGTETGLKQLVHTAHRAGLDVHTDLVINHNGFRDASTPGFVNAGGYPGFVLQDPDGDPDPAGIPNTDGDFHGRFASGRIEGRISGLIDIDHRTNHAFIRHPVDPDDPRNIPAGTIYNRPDHTNTRFYPDRDLGGVTVHDPRLGETVTLHDFNTTEPLAGDPVPENATGLLMRHARWMVQEVGVDGFRIDAARHVHPWVLDFLDRAVFRASQRPHLDGSRRDVFSFSEVLDGDMGLIQQYVRKDIADANTVGGNRDALDFPLFFAMRDNLTANGLANDWRNVKNASFAVHDDGLANDGSQGVAFVSSHDDFGPHLDDVAQAYVLMRPGPAIVYMNGRQFGDRDFPKPGRDDALGGPSGETITTLVRVRQSHGRGNYIDRTPAADEKELLIFERENAAIVALSNRLDAGFDARTVQTAFAPGTPLIELTGHAVDPTIDPFDDLPGMLRVRSDGTVNLRVPRNRAPGAGGVEHGSGYVIYGPATPRGTLSISNVATTLEGRSDKPASDPSDAITTRIHDVHVVTDDAFQVRLETAAFILPDGTRDRDADGDNALLRFDDGLDVNGNGAVDHVTPGSVVYGFEAFETTRQPGITQPDGHGLYVQDIDATALAEGYHFIEARAFRRRDAGEPSLFSSFRQTVYVDRLPPQSELASFEPLQPDLPRHRDLVVRSVDRTADNVHVFIDLPAAMSDEDVLAMLGSGNETIRIDRDLWRRPIFNLTHGNHVATVVAFEVTGNVNVQRFAGLFTETELGAGLGDVTFDGLFKPDDLDAMVELVLSEDTAFSPAGDFTADGRVTLDDWWLLGDRLHTLDAYESTLLDPTTLDRFQTLSRTIPEPASIGVFGIVAALMLRRRTN